MTALDIPATPAELDAAGNPIAAAAYIAATIDALFADLRLAFPAPCPTCAAVGDAPCVTASGRVARTHRGRA